MSGEPANFIEGQPTVTPEGSKVTKIAGVQLSVAPGKGIILCVHGTEQNHTTEIIETWHD